MMKIAYVLILSLLLWPACSTQVATSQNMSKEVEDARLQKQIYQDNVQAKLRSLDQQIDSLKVRIKQENRTDRKELDQQIADLDRKRAIAHQQLEKLQNSSEAAWQDMKVGINAAMGDLETAYARAAAQFK